MQSHSQALSEDGGWLCAEGPNRDYVAAWCELNPNLKRPDSKNRWFPLKTGNARVVIELGKPSRLVMWNALVASGRVLYFSTRGVFVPYYLTPQFYQRPGS
jgi:hypothetical protein